MAERNTASVSGLEIRVRSSSLSFPCVGLERRSVYYVLYLLKEITADAQGSSEILIYGHLPSAQPESYASAEPSTVPPELSLVARRIVPVPSIPPPVMRLPRPDDPTPRKPPLVIFGKKAVKAQRTSSSKLKEPEPEDSSIKHRKEAAKTLPRTGSAKNLGRSSSFRIPDDVFGSTSIPLSIPSGKGKGKGKIEGLSSEQFQTLNKAVSVTTPRSSFVSGIR